MGECWLKAGRSVVVYSIALWPRGRPAALLGRGGSNRLQSARCSYAFDAPILDIEATRRTHRAAGIVPDRSAKGRALFHPCSSKVRQKKKKKKKKKVPALIPLL